MHFYIVSDDVYIGPDVILGMNVIDSHDLTLMRKRGCTHFVDQRQMLDFASLANELIDNCAVVTCRDKVDIPHCTVQHVSAPSSMNPTELIVPVTNYSGEKVILGEGQPSIEIQIRQTTLQRVCMS